MCRYFAQECIVGISWEFYVFGSGHRQVVPYQEPWNSLLSDKIFYIVLGWFHCLGPSFVWFTVVQSRGIQNTESLLSSLIIVQIIGSH